MSATATKQPRLSEEAQKNVEPDVEGEQPGYLDVIFEVDGEEVRFSSHLLAMSSPVFEAMLFGRVNSKEKRTKHIPIVDFTAHEIKLILDYLMVDRTMSAKKVTDESLVPFCLFAHKYKLDVALRDCEAYLDNWARGPDQCWLAFVFGAAFGFLGLTTRAIFSLRCNPKMSFKHFTAQISQFTQSQLGQRLGVDGHALQQLITIGAAIRGNWNKGLGVASCSSCKKEAAWTIPEGSTCWDNGECIAKLCMKICNASHLWTGQSPDRSLRDDTFFVDAVLMVKGTSLHFSSHLLAIYSSYFEREFFGPHKTESTTVKISDKFEVADIQALQSYLAKICCGITTTLPAEHVISFYQFAVEYEMPGLSKACRSSLLNDWLIKQQQSRMIRNESCFQPGSCFLALLIGASFGFEDVCQKAFNIISHGLNSVPLNIQVNGFLSSNLMSRLGLSVESVLHIFSIATESLTTNSLERPESAVCTFCAKRQCTYWRIEDNVACLMEKCLAKLCVKIVAEGPKSRKSRKEKRKVKKDRPKKSR